MEITFKGIKQEIKYILSTAGIAKRIQNIRI